ncbi:hypothetical protein F5051DRAFT_452016 [Lentinula edodes]|nr:hypothetical protein F5051DRAFT_452016 [Lentinula edodes]
MSQSNGSSHYLEDHYHSLFQWEQLFVTSPPISDYSHRRLIDLQEQQLQQGIQARMPLTQEPLQYGGGDIARDQPQFLHVEIPQNIVVGPQSGITSSPATSYLHSPYSAQGGHALSGTPIQSQTAALLQCPECAKSLRSRQSLNSHIEAIHRKNKRFSCPYCHRLFSFQQALRRHERESRCPSSRNLPS